MKGLLFSILAGVFLALQGVVNSRVGQDIGTWKAVMINQLGGFILAGLILVCMRGGNWRGFREVKPLYLLGGAFAAIIVFSNISAMHLVGATLTVSAVLISQLCLTFVIDSKGWFDTARKSMHLPQFVGIGIMIAGVIILRLS
ncbi:MULTISPECIES: DMT family transporter [Paenibacillus]|uniref:DMT family transporter n=1 Tax=Paenibacillus TaxID=44249 RepID=UPI00037BFAA0|nr:MULTISPECIES: DMT family transporter [Paenibacillus]